MNAWSADPPESNDEAATPERSPYYDIVHYIGKSGDQTVKVRPYPNWLEPPLPKGKEFSFELFTQGSGRAIYRVKSEQIKQIDYFEIRMAEQAAKRLGVTFDEMTRPATAVDVSRAKDDGDVIAVERMLADAIDGHNSAVQQGRRRGPEWDEHVLRPLQAALVNVRLGHIDAMIAGGDAVHARELCDRLAASLRAAPALLRPALEPRYEALLLAPAERAADDHDYSRARRLLDEFTAQFRPVDPEERAAKLSQRLRADATKLLERAEALPADRQREAMALIDMAAKAAPELTQIDALRRRLKTAYPTLVCAYAELPTTWLPQNARLTVERHAAALLFERLVVPAADEAGFQPQLAVEFPRALAKGRSFELPRAPPAKWSDFSDREPYLVTAADVAWTIRLLSRDTLPGFSPAWPQALAGAEPAGENPFRLNIRLSRDHWQPLSFMHFAVLPKHRFPQGGAKPEWQAFAENPVGSGPYRLAEHEEQSVHFVANTNYHLPERPIVREVTFQLIAPDEAVLQLHEKRLHVVADVPPALVKQVQERGDHVATLHPPSVWFLAPNFRRSAMTNQDLRLALAHAVDRRAILDAVFRATTSAADHIELTGPFPSTSWAYDHDVAAFDPQQAGPFAEEAKRKLGDLPPLKLIYRASEPGAEQACQQIAAQTVQVGIHIDPVGLSAADFFPRILDAHDFDLAYWRHDFGDETYWLGGLLDADPRAAAPGGPNFVGYTPDASVIEFFRDLALHKRFVDLQRTMHKLHAHIARTAIVIPLWQLSTYMAIDDSLAAIEFDPMAPFANVANWEFKTGK